MKLFIFLLSINTFTLHSNAQKLEIILTDSSRIEIGYYPGGKEVQEIVYNKNLVHRVFYYRKSNIILSLGDLDTLGHRSGVWKVFDTTGTLLYYCDYEKRMWNPVQENLYPHRELLNEIKIKGDSLVKKTYGVEFFNKFVKWNFDCCAVYGPDGNFFARSWTEPFEKKPAEFKLRYDIQIDENYIAEEMIEFDLDINGKFLPNPYQEKYGFENLQNKADNMFKLTIKSAIDSAKQYGLSVNDSIKPQAFIKWLCNKSDKFYNGRYLFYIVQETGHEKTQLNQPNMYMVKTYFDVWKFNPWTGEFMEKKKMHGIYYNEKFGGFNTDLIEDK